MLTVRLCCSPAGSRQSHQHQQQTGVYCSALCDCETHRLWPCHAARQNRSKETKPSQNLSFAQTKPKMSSLWLPSQKIPKSRWLKQQRLGSSRSRYWWVQCLEGTSFLVPGWHFFIALPLAEESLSSGHKAPSFSRTLNTITLGFWNWGDTVYSSKLP